MECAVSRTALYRKVDQSARVEQASPHALVAVLLAQALDQVDVMTAALARGRRIPEVHARANDVLFALEATLNHETGGTTAKLMAQVYRETRRCLDEASRTGDAACCKQARATLQPIAEAWAAIGATPAGREAEVSPDS